MTSDEWISQIRGKRVAEYTKCKHHDKTCLEMYEEYGADDLLLWTICQQEQIEALKLILEAARRVETHRGYNGEEDYTTGVDYLEDAIEEYDFVVTTQNE